MNTDVNGTGSELTFAETGLLGAFIVESKCHFDERGTFARIWDQSVLKQLGSDFRIEQCSISCNERKGTLRGMHYQSEPYQETKIVRCLRGALYDVIIDLRPHSPTFKQHFGLELTSNNRRMLYIPEGIAHGFLTLTDHTEVLYLISQRYDADSACGVRWNDPAFGVQWPDEIRVISARDQRFPDFTA
jgi:dTDP-4-dehydrorhamnose 3,5-epimerase